MSNNAGNKSINVSKIELQLEASPIPGFETCGRVSSTKATTA